MLKCLLIVLIVVNVSCNTKKLFKQDHTDPLSDILEVRDTYLELIKGVQHDPSGYIEFNRCDSALFTGLISAGGAKVNLFAARNPDTHQWFRGPFQDCYRNERRDVSTTRRSKSEISRDGLIGIFWGLRYQDNLPALDELLNYGRDNKWVMGKGPLDRTYMTPAMQDTLYRIQNKDYKGLPYAWVDPIKDHQRHVVALNIILRGEHEGKIDDSMFGLLEDFRTREPSNALFQFGFHRFGDGNQTETIEILKRFPKDRLPTNNDWKSEWLWMRSEASSDWQPGNIEKTHSGGDLIFIAKLLERAQR